MGTYIYIKGVTERFGFDAIRISQIHRLVKNKATGTPQGCFICKLSVCLVRKAHRRADYIQTSAWGFRRCSFRLTGQCESLYSVERVTGLAPRFLCIYLMLITLADLEPVSIWKYEIMEANDMQWSSTTPELFIILIGQSKPFYLGSGLRTMFGSK